MKKELLFAKLRKQTTATYDMPNMAINAIQYEDTYKKFVEMSIAAGCRIQPITPKDNLCEVVKNYIQKQRSLQVIFRLLLQLSRKIQI